MAYIGITASGDGLAAADGGDLDTRLERALATLGPGAPVVVLIHGYKFDPARPADDPHRTLYAFQPIPRSWKVRSWPAGLGFDADDPAEGLCLGFGWPAVEPHLPTLIAAGRTGFARVYERAGAMALRLAELVARLQALAPEREVDLLAHSLGARVALGALAHLDLAPGRIVLLGAAEFDARAREALAACPAPRPPMIYNVTARANDFYDAAFETFAPRRDWGERAVGLGLRDPLPFWLDLQLDRADVTEWVNAQGIPLRPAEARLCHWSFYTRSGAFEVYQAILRRRRGWDIPSLRAAPCFAAQEPRWSRLLRPRLPRLRPALPADLGAGLSRA
jgi:pimeloyl-ACP methyl ester carboxylesterase